MKNVIKDTVSLSTEELITNKIFLDGDDIGYSILPKLVHRTTLEPQIEGEEVVNKQYYTLHNDAGQCVYVSPSLSEYMYTRWWRRWWWKGGGGGSGWYFLPIVLPPHPGGKGKRRPRPKKTYVEDISWYYYADPNTKVPIVRDRNWKPSTVKRAVSAWEISNIEKFGLQFTKVEDCTRMFYGCRRLKSFYSTNFQQCKNATGMFEGCDKLSKFSSRPAVFKRVQYASRMFAGCGLKEVELYMPEMLNSNSMFEGCDKLQHIKIKMNKCQVMTNMFKNCRNLIEVQFPKDDMSSTINYLGSVTDATSAFMYTSLSNFTVPQMKSLSYADEMFRDCESLYQIETLYPVLETANHMFRNCKDLRYFSVHANSDETMAKFPLLKSARYMFRDCEKFQPIDFKDDSFPILEDGMCMFDNVYLTNKIPCKFPALKNARQMFRNANISGAFDLDMPTYFPNVGLNEYPNGDYPTAYMFGFCPITSISFDVSTCDHCISMFSNCKQLRQCTKAVFKEGSNCQSMFTESMFDIPSARIIIAAASLANVSALHIGMDVQYRTEEFRNEFGFTQVDEGYDDQWQHPSANIIIRWNQQ